MDSVTALEYESITLFHFNEGGQVKNWAIREMNKRKLSDDRLIAQDKRVKIVFENNCVRFTVAHVVRRLVFGFWSLVLKI